jgi:hypothetical protein
MSWNVAAVMCPPIRRHNGERWSRASKLTPAPGGPAITVGTPLLSVVLCQGLPRKANTAVLSECLTEDSDL